MTHKNAFRVDYYLVPLHLLALLSSYIFHLVLPHSPNPKSMAGIFFLIVIVLGAMAGLIILGISLPRLNRQIPYFALKKFLLACGYWLSSSFIFIFMSLSKYFYDTLFAIAFFVLFFFGSLYLSVLKSADMRFRDYLILAIIFSVSAVFFYF